MLNSYSCTFGLGCKTHRYSSLLDICVGGTSVGLSCAMSTISAKELAYAVTTQAFTRNFRHLLPVPRFLVRGPLLPGQSRPKDTKPKDRIQYWNIVPGDLVKLRGDTKGTVHEVFRVNKLSNRVILKREINKAVSKTTSCIPVEVVDWSGCIGLCAASECANRVIGTLLSVSTTGRKVRVPT